MPTPHPADIACPVCDGRETISCTHHPQAPSGNTPNSLCLTPDGQLLFVANADANNLAVFNVATPGQAGEQTAGVDPALAALPQSQTPCQPARRQQPR